MDFQQIIAKQKEFIRDITFNLDPNKCILFSNTKTDRHFTIVVLMPPEIRRKMSQFAQKLQEIEPSLILNDPEFYHLTLYWVPGDRNPDKVRKFLTDYFAHYHFDFNLSNLFNSPKGIGVSALPTDESFIELRNSLSREFNFPYTMPDFLPMSWITIARFTEKPSQKLIDFLKNNFDTDFGYLKVKEINILESENKNLAGAKKIAIIIIYRIYGCKRI